MRPAITGHAVNTTYTDVGSADIAEEQISVIPAADGPAITGRIINVLISTKLNVV